MSMSAFASICAETDRTAASAWLQCGCGRELQPIPTGKNQPLQPLPDQLMKLAQFQVEVLFRYELRELVLNKVVARLAIETLLLHRWSEQARLAPRSVAMAQTGFGGRSRAQGCSVAPLT
jgi:hypothetical protein